MKAKKWWQIGVAKFSNSVQRYYLLSVLLLILASSFMVQALDQFPKIGWMFYAALICWIGFIFSVTKYAKKSKQEYGANNQES